MKKHQSARRRGVTLLELLVAMTLFSLLSGALFWSLRLGLSTLSKTRDFTVSARRTWGAQRALESMLAGLTPTSAEFTLPGTTGLDYAPFFQGEGRAMRFLTAHSLSGGARSSPRLVELAVIPGENQQGLRLIVNEFPYLGPASLGVLVMGRTNDPLTSSTFLDFRPVQAGPNSFVLADKLTECQFLYLDRGPAITPDLWRSRWPTGYLPRAVRIEMGGQRRVTASIHVSQLLHP